MPLEIVRNDITKVVADAIVNTANPEVAYGEGVDSAIYAAAGADKLLKERAKIGKMIPGTAAATPAFDLLGKAGLTLSGSSAFDIIIKYCIENHITNVLDINCILFEHEQPLLGA